MEEKETKNKINIKGILDKMSTCVEIYDGSKPLYDGAPQPEKQSLYFGCDLDGIPTIGINWVKKGRGFGQYWFQLIDGKMICDSECDSRESVKEILCDMVDQCIFVDEKIK